MQLNKGRQPEARAQVEGPRVNYVWDNPTSACINVYNNFVTLQRFMALSPKHFDRFHQGVTKRDVVYLGWPIAPSNMSQNAGGRGLSQWVQLCTWSPNKLWRYYSIFNLCFYATFFFFLFCKYLAARMFYIYAWKIQYYYVFGVFSVGSFYKYFLYRKHRVIIKLMQ